LADSSLWPTELIVLNGGVCTCGLEHQAKWFFQQFHHGTAESVVFYLGTYGVAELCYEITVSVHGFDLVRDHYSIYYLVSSPGLQVST
jgi:hypothetical protein